MLPVNGVALDRLIGEGRQEAFAFHRQNLLAVELGGILRPGDVDASGHDVDHVADLVTELPLGRHAGRPMDDQRRGDAPFMVEMLVAASGVFESVAQDWPS